MLYIFSIVLVIISNVFYQIIQKSTPHDSNPILSLIITYFTAAIACLVILPFYPGKEELSIALKKLNWTSVSLGIAIIGLELGFLLAYRAGWSITTAGVFANVTVALVLIPVGIMAFKEQISLTNLSGILLCIIGLALITKK